MGDKAKAIAKFLYEETNKYATSITYMFPFKVIEKAFLVDMDNPLFQNEIREATLDYDNIINIDIDNIRKHIVVMIYEKEPIKQKMIELPVCYVHLIQDCLQTVAEYNLIRLIYGKGMTENEEKATISDVQEVLDNFCKPLDELDQDTTIIIDEGGMKS